MESVHEKLNTILLFDGIAIFFIVLYHALGAQPTNPLHSLNSYIVFLGLSLFTFSSGYKLMINHSDKLNEKKFLSEYYIKRFMRLYKPYFGYTLLMLFPVFLVNYIAIYVFHFDYPGLTFFTTINNMNVFNFIIFLFGGNPIAGQLWYLVALVVITSVCFTILYFLDIKWLFFSFIPFFLILCLIKIEVINNINILDIFTYLPFFILGCYSAYNHYYNKTTNWSKITHSLFPVCFVILIISSILQQALIIRSILILFSCLFFPFFLLSIFDYLKKAKFVFSFILLCGTYSFQIYLFQGPIIMPILLRTTIYILKIDYYFIPVLISFLTIYLSIIVYGIVKKVGLNVVFE
jgi:peptidoglycan/LPS O-acetylase OafA/YrhL